MDAFVRRLQGGLTMNIVKEKHTTDLTMEEQYKIALFMLIRNRKILESYGIPKDGDFKEIDMISYMTMLSVLDMVSWELAKQSFEEGKTAYEELKAMVEK